MADDEAPKQIHPAEPILYLFFGAAILSAIFYRFEVFLSSHGGLALFLNTFWLFLQGQASFSQVIGSTQSPGLEVTFFILRILAFALSGVFVWLIFSTRGKLREWNEKLRAPLKTPKDIHYGVGMPAEERLVNPRWVKVLEHINSQNPGDWKLSILEADIMLADMLESMNYHGETISDKLKGIEASDFDTLQDAWDAHKVRNAIAHEGSDFQLNKPEAERVVKQFKKVFEEFKYI